jgi:hypothetical protein
VTVGNALILALETFWKGVDSIPFGVDGRARTLVRALQGNKLKTFLLDALGRADLELLHDRVWPDADCDFRMYVEDRDLAQHMAYLLSQEADADKRLSRLSGINRSDAPGLDYPVTKLPGLLERVDLEMMIEDGEVVIGAKK